MDNRAEKRRKKRMRRIMLMLTMLIPLFYIGAQMVLMVKASYQTQTVISYTMSDTVSCDGMLAMQETQVEGRTDGVLGYQVNNGERVSAGSEVARVFADEESARSRAAAERLTQQIETLERSQKNTGADMEMLMNQNQQGVYSALDILESGNYAKLSAACTEIQIAQNSMQLTAGAVPDFSARIEELKAQRDAAERASSYTALTAPQTGYFVSSDDSQKQLYSAQQLKDMSPAELNEALKSPREANDPQLVGKLILDYRWHYYGIVPYKQAEKFIKGTQVKIAFPGVSAEQVPAVVVGVTVDEENQIAKVDLLCDYINSTVVTLEHARADIIFATYNGLRIDRKALHIIEGENCVFVKFGNVIYQRDIKILFEDTDYILIPTIYEKDVNEVKMFDEVIVHGADLYDEKIL